jgi:hypothetical protein
MKKCLTYCSLFLIFGSFIVLNNNNFTALVKEKLQNYSSIEWPEKVYIQTDKSYYSIDESIWFTAYLVNGITHLKSTKSKVLYVELINNQDSIISKRRLFIDDVNVQGDFKIRKDWKEGKYILRAYTNYMRNDDPNYFFQKEIDIWARDKKQKISSLVPPETQDDSIISDKPDLYFYPEGGYLVENLTSKVAIKIKNDIYNKIHLTGYITDSDNIFISDFKTSDFGLGFFFF